MRTSKLNIYSARYDIYMYIRVNHTVFISLMDVAALVDTRLFVRLRFMRVPYYFRARANTFRNNYPVRVRCRTGFTKPLSAISPERPQPKYNEPGHSEWRRGN